MRLYYTAWSNNFGDALNAWLWDRLLGPDLRTAAPDDVFIGIGSMLNHRVPARPSKYVFGTGVGYGHVPVPDDTWHVGCVRGPLSARALGLDPDAAVTDSALLVVDAVDPTPPPRLGVSYIAHCRGHLVAPWAKIAEAAGMSYICPFLDSRAVIDRIRRSELLVTEALHGAIIADAFDVPWIPVRCYPWVKRFKWRDWHASMGLDYRPHRLPPVLPGPRIARALAKRLTRLPHERRLDPARRTPLYDAPYRLLSPSAHRLYRRRIDAVARRLEHIRTHARPMLASPDVRRQRLDELRRRLDRFRTTWLAPPSG